MVEIAQFVALALVVDERVELSHKLNEPGFIDLIVLSLRDGSGPGVPVVGDPSGHN